MTTTTALAHTNGNNGGADRAAIIDAQVIEKLVMTGDVSKLGPQERTRYYVALCDSVGVPWQLQPFDFMTGMGGGLKPYANRKCTDYLRLKHHISVSVVSIQVVDGILEVRARATTPDGRSDEDVGAVNVANLRADALANAKMKAITKAKRRVTLSICGLGLSDETEVETIPNAQTVTAAAMLEGPVDPAAELLATLDACDDVDAWKEANKAALRKLSRADKQRVADAGSMRRAHLEAKRTQSTDPDDDERAAILAAEQEAAEAEADVHHAGDE